MFEERELATTQAPSPLVWAGAAGSGQGTLPLCPNAGDQGRRLLLPARGLDPEAADGCTGTRCSPGSPSLLIVVGFCAISFWESTGHCFPHHERGTPVGCNLSGFGDFGLGFWGCFPGVTNEDLLQDSGTPAPDFGPYFIHLCTPEDYFLG